MYLSQNKFKRDLYEMKDYNTVNLELAIELIDDRVEIIKNVMYYKKDGSVLLVHDTKDNTHAYVLQYIKDYYFINNF